MRSTSGKRRGIAAAVALAVSVTLAAACSWNASGEGDAGATTWGPEGEFVSVSAGSAHTCGLENGRLRRLLGLRCVPPGHAAGRGVRLRQRRG